MSVPPPGSDSAPHPPAWRLLPGGHGMNVGLIAPGVEAHTVRERLTADWHLLDMWNEREIQARAAECAVFLVAPGKARSSAIQEKLLLLEAQDTDSSVPTVCYAAVEPDDPLIKVVGSGQRVCTLVHRGTEDGFLQEEILEAAVRPFFWHLSRTIAGIDDLDPTLCEFLAALVAQPVPHFDQALAIDGAGIPPFVRKVQDAPRLASGSLSLIRERAREKEIVLREFFRRNAYLGGLARYLPDHVHLYRLARRLAYNQADSMTRALRRVGDAPIREAVETRLGQHAEVLLRMLPGAMS